MSPKTDVEENDMVIERIRRVTHPSTVIPKPEAEGEFKVEGDGIRRGEDAIIYAIPNHTDPSHPYRKGVTASELDKAFNRLSEFGEFSRQWFLENLPACAKEGDCNFTTIGGLFQLIGEAAYDQRGIYRKTAAN